MRPSSGGQWVLLDPSSFSRHVDPDEVVFVLLQELVTRDPYPIVRNRSQYLQDHPDVVRVLMGQIDPLAAALCAREAAAQYAQTGRREQAHTALAAAIALYRSIDMTLWIPQAEAALAQVG